MVATLRSKSATSENFSYNSLHRAKFEFNSQQKRNVFLPDVSVWVIVALNVWDSLYETENIWSFPRRVAIVEVTATGAARGRTFYTPEFECLHARGRKRDGKVVCSR